MSRLLEQRTAIVTGATSGIGRSVSLKLAEEGAHVYMVGRDQDQVDQLASLIRQKGGQASGAVVDVKDTVALQGVFERAVAETGRLNITVNNAGVAYPSAIIDGKAEQWKEMLEVNVLAVLVGCQAAIRLMRQHHCPGHIVNISSIAARREGSNVYGATKAALNVIGETLRAELENDPIRIVQIMPGAVITNFARHFPAAFINGLLKQFGESHVFSPGELLPQDVQERLLARGASIFAGPEDVAGTILFAITQPINLDLFELVVRPAKALPL